jgi:uncharacterized protein (DUF427 family)
MRDAMMGRWPELRYEPTEKRIRVWLGDEVVVDTTRAVLVWEPRRIVPSYAVPLADLLAELSPDPETTMDNDRLLHPGIPFSVHSTPGNSFSIRSRGNARSAAAFQPADADLAGYAVLDFNSFDQWLEEDDPVVSHPRDPFHRVDVRSSSRHVRIELNGERLAETTRPSLLFETNLPTRFYLPADDIADTLQPSDRVTYCAYKGQASYWSHDDQPNVAWTYRAPLPDAVQIAGMVAFYDDLVDTTVDGVLRERPSTPVAKSLLEEFH